MAAKKPALLLIFLTVFVDLLGFGIVIPIMPKVAVEYGASPAIVGWLVMSYSLMQFFLTPFWGRLSDKIGRRPVLLVSLGASCVGYLLWGLAGTLPMLFASRLVAGAGNANIAVAQAYITDVTTEENRSKGMGLIGAAFGLGFTFGPAIGGFASSMGLAAVGYVAAAFSAVAFLLAMFALPEPEKRSNAGTERFAPPATFYFDTLKERSMAGSLAIFFLSTFAFAGMEATLALLTFQYYSFGQKDISMLFAFIGLVMVFVQGGLIGRLSKRTSEKKLMAVGAFIVACGLLVTVLVKTVPGLYTACALLALGLGISNPSNQSLLSKLAPEQSKGAVLGVGQSLSTAGRIAGPLAAGYAFQFIAPETPYFSGAAVMLLVMALSFTLPEPQAKKPLKTPEPVAVK